MAVFHASADRPTIEPVLCVCGRKAEYKAIEVWDAPGDMAPIIDHYSYHVQCPFCGIQTQKWTEPDEAIDAWNRFMSKVQLCAKAQTDWIPAAKLAIESIKETVKDLGGCDHSVGICMCKDIRALEALETRVAIAEGKPDPHREPPMPEEES